MGNRKSSLDLDTSEEEEKTKIKAKSGAQKQRPNRPRLQNRQGSFQLEGGQIGPIQKMYTQINRCQGPSFPGSVIFEGIFIRAPDAKDIFATAGFHGHYVKFSQTLSHIIAHLDDLGSTSEMLVGLGRKHVEFRAMGFRPSLWDVFAESMIHCTLDWGARNQRNDSTQEAWTKIVLFIIDRMRAGYLLELRSLAASGKAGDGSLRTSSLQTPQPSPSAPRKPSPSAPRKPSLSTPRKPSPFVPRKPSLSTPRKPSLTIPATEKSPALKPKSPSLRVKSSTTQFVAQPPSSSSVPSAVDQQLSALVQVATRSPSLTVRSAVGHSAPRSPSLTPSHRRPAVMSPLAAKLQPKSPAIRLGAAASSSHLCVDAAGDTPRLTEERKVRSTESPRTKRTPSLARQTRVSSIEQPAKEDI